MNRRVFVAAAASAMMLPTSRTSARAAESMDDRAAAALVFVGGGARGAFEAGVIDGLRAAAGTADGARLPGTDLVCGTSIGALNAWFVATGAYTPLAALWRTAASENIFQIKRRYAATASKHAFILTKIVESLSLVRGMTTNVTGILDGDAVQRWIDRHVDPATPLLVPYTFTVTNLDRNRIEIFYRLPFDSTAADRRAALARLYVAVGPHAVVREADDTIFLRALRASTAIPVLFDPVPLPSPEGGIEQYVDGGIADNAPVDVGRALAKAVYAVLVDPSTRPSHDRNAVEIDIDAFGIAQQRIFSEAIRAGYLESESKRLVRDARLSAAQRRFFDAVPDADFFIVRPEHVLPVEVAEFDRQTKIDAAYDLGRTAGAGGFSRYVLDIPAP